MVANEGAYIAYDASEKLKEDLELNPAGMTIRFFENVEIDETCISHRKYNRGRLVKEVWVTIYRHLYYIS